MRWGWYDQRLPSSKGMRASGSASRAAIDGAMNGNVCRCATYGRIRQAIHRAAKAAGRAAEAAGRAAKAAGGDA